MADKKRQPIEWQRMSWRWWLEAVAKLAVWAAILAGITSLVGDDQPHWVYQVAVFCGFIVGVLLIPELPRQGDDALSLKDSLLGTGAIVLTIAGILLAIALFFVLPGVIGAVIGPIFAPLANWVARHFTLDTILLLVVIFMLVDLYGRVEKR